MQMSQKWNHIRQEAYNIGPRDTLPHRGRKKRVRYELIAFVIAIGLLAARRASRVF